MFAVPSFLIGQNQIHFTKQVAQSEDDAEENKSNGSVNLTSSDLELCYDKGFLGIGSKDQWVGIRFTQVDVPKNALIDSCFIQFTSDETEDETAITMIYGEKMFNSPSFSDLDENITARTRTDSMIYWSIPAWNNSDESGPNQKTPNLAGIFKEVIAQPIWQSNNAVSFIMEGTGTRNSYSYDGSAADSPVLHVVYRENNVSLDVNDFENIAIYPNPYSENLFVSLSEISTNDGVDVKVYSPEGRLVFSHTLLAGKKHNLVDYGFDYKGIGFLTLSNQQFTVSKKIISH